MPIIKHHQFIEAPVEICFNLARNVVIHTKTSAKTKETAVDGVTQGLLEEGDTVTWEATHLGIKQRLTAKVTHMEKPIEFVDIMLKRPFHSFTPIGWIADKLFLEKYMTRFIISRAKELKSFAEKQNRLLR
ncbi:SRPBCC family protein [Gracilibacillus sp. D59]|uniref:SRPBCC family protein n=1 Tax=Gracilibacillus sp. D59 TaxID=3457434 RepID=UPI003FCC37E6